MSRSTQDLSVSGSETETVDALEAALTTVTVVRANDPETAIEILENRSIDAVVSTYRLDSGTGIDLLGRIRDEWPTLPVFLVVTDGSEAIAARATQQDVTEYVRADEIDAEALETRIERAVDQARTDRDLVAERKAFVQGPAVIFRWGTDPEWPIEFVSENVENVLGYTPAELESEHTYAELVHPDDLAHLREEARKYTEGEIDRLGHDPYRIRTRDGEYRWVLEHTRTITDPVTGSEQLFGYVIDITKRRKKELELQQFQEAAEQTDHAVYITDPDGHIEYVNPAFGRITGYERDQVLGETVGTPQSELPANEFHDTFWAAIETGETVELTMDRAGAEGDELVLHQTVSPITDESGAVRKYVAVAQDVTELKEYERQLESQRDNLEVLNQVVRHDIRNNLQLVLAYVQMVLSAETSETDHLEKALEATHSAVEITETARDMTAVMLQSEADLTPISLETVLTRQIEDIDTSHQDVEIDTKSIPAVDVMADDMLGSVFRNLLSNAIQHNDRSEPVVAISVEVDGEGAVVEIADNGPGISAAERERIFEKGRTGLKSEGTGLGLHLVQTLVDRYEGSVSVRNNEPNGTVFEIRLPVAA